MELLLAYIVLGVFAGTMAGLLGVGGGLIMVPVLALLWQAENIGGTQMMQLAIGTSLAVIVFTSISSVRAHHLRGGVVWPIFWRLTPGILLGAALGATTASVLPQDLLRLIFGVFELFVAAQMGLKLKLTLNLSRLPGAAGMGLAGTVIGAVSAIVGIGGGTLTVPFLHACKLRMQQAIGTSAACGLPIAVSAAVSYMLLGWDNAQMPSAAAGFVYLPAVLGIAASSVLFAPLGAALAHRLPGEVLKQVFAVFLALLGLWMLVSQLG